MKKVQIKLSIAGLLLSGICYGQGWVNDTISFTGQETMEVQRMEVKYPWNPRGEAYVMLDNDTIMIPFPYSSMNIQTSPGRNDAAITGETEWLIDEDYKAIQIGFGKYKIVSGYVAEEIYIAKECENCDEID
jgi:hypothetical protein